MTRRLRIAAGGERHPEVDEAIASLQSLYAAETLCAIATMTPTGAPHINNAFFAPIGTYDLTIWTDPKTQHGLNLKSSPRASIAVAGSACRWGEDVHGAQLEGRLELAVGALAQDAFTAYSQRYEGLAEWASNIDDSNENFKSRFYVLHVDRIKLIDEARFGKEVYVVAERD